MSRTIALLLVALALGAPAPASAEPASVPLAIGSATGVARLAAPPGPIAAAASRHAARQVAMPRRPAYLGASPARQRGVGRKILGGIAGGVGGFFAGGYLGASLQPDCRCDDPGLQGALIGAPIGAAVGATLGALFL